MKTILVDAVNTFVIKDEGIYEPMHKLLMQYPNKKIILTNANSDEMKKIGLNNMPYEVFTLKHNPEKTSPEYYKIMLKSFQLIPETVVYFEHNKEAVQSAKLADIQTMLYDSEKKDLKELKKFLDKHL